MCWTEPLTNTALQKIVMAFLRRTFKLAPARVKHPVNQKHEPSQWQSPERLDWRFRT